MLSLILSLILAPTPAHAYACTPGTLSPGPGCWPDLEERCESDHHDALAQFLQKGYALEARAAALSGEIAGLNDDLAGRRAALAALETKAALGTAEISFAPTRSTASAEIFPDFPVLEELFSLPSPQREWLDRYSQDRAKRLSEELHAIEIEKNEQSGQMQAIQLNIATLQAQIDSAKSDEAGNNNSVTFHLNWCRTTCRVEFCPGSPL